MHATNRSYRFSKVRPVPISTFDYNSIKFNAFDTCYELSIEHQLQSRYRHTVSRDPVQNVALLFQLYFIFKYSFNYMACMSHITCTENSCDRFHFEGVNVQNVLRSIIFNLPRYHGYYIIKNMVTLKAVVIRNYIFMF